jgi:hypothetical protein
MQGKALLMRTREREHAPVSGTIARAFQRKETNQFTSPMFLKKRINRTPGNGDKRRQAEKVPSALQCSLRTLKGRQDSRQVTTSDHRPPLYLRQRWSIVAPVLLELKYHLGMKPTFCSPSLKKCERAISAQSSLSLSNSRWFR